MHRQKDCKHFDQGRKECPFNDRCFYRHAYPDGRLASPKPKRTRSRRVQTDDSGDTVLLDELLLLGMLGDSFPRRLQIVLDSDEEELLYLIDDSDSDSDDFGLRSHLYLWRRLCL